MSNANPVSHLRTEAQLAEHATEIRRLGRRAIEDIIGIGLRLIAAKELCGHGAWLPWLEREFGWGERTARNYMAVAERFKSATIADLNISLSALYALAAPSTPAEIVEQVVARGREGTTITYQNVVEAMAARNTSYTRDVEAETPARLVRILETTHEHVVLPRYPPAPPPPELRSHDFHGLLIRATAKAVLQHLDAIAFDLAGQRDIGAIVEAMSDDEQDRFRKGVEAVAKLKAALDTNVIRFPH